MAKFDIGKYAVQITGQGFQKAATGTMQLVIQFNVIGKVDPLDPETLISVQTGERKYYKAITENTIEWVMDDLKLLGVEELTSWAQLDPNTDGFIDLTGKEVDMMCGSRNGNDGKAYEDWSIARAGGGGKPIEHVAPKEVQSLDRMFGRFLKKPAARPTAVPQAAPKRQPVAAAVADEDVPF